MTIPYERTRAVVETKSFLRALLDTEQMPQVSDALRQQAEYLLRHYPSYADIELAHRALPDLFGPVPPFQQPPAKTAITELGLDTLNVQDRN